jgi:hypothetical protein
MFFTDTTPLAGMRPSAGRAGSPTRAGGRAYRVATPGVQTEAIMSPQPCNRQWRPTYNRYSASSSKSSIVHGCPVSRAAIAGVPGSDLFFVRPGVSR